MQKDYVRFNETYKQFTMFFMIFKENVAKNSFTRLVKDNFTFFFCIKRLGFKNYSYLCGVFIPKPCLSERRVKLSLYSSERRGGSPERQVLPVGGADEGWRPIYRKGVLVKDERPKGASS